VFLVLGFQAKERGLFRLQEIEIEKGANLQDEFFFQSIRDSLSAQIQPLVGQYIWKVRLEGIMQKIEGDQRIEAAHISRLFPNRLRIVIEPHRPILAVLTEDNKVYPLAPDGTLMTALAITEGPDLPLLRGKQFIKDEALRKKAIQLFNELPESGSFSQKIISEINYSQKAGFSLILSNLGTEVRVGEADLGRKASRVEKVMSYLENHQIKGRVIDARFTKKVVVRLRNEP